MKILQCRPFKSWNADIRHHRYHCHSGQFDRLKLEACRGRKERKREKSTRSENRTAGVMIVRAHGGRGCILTSSKKLRSWVVSSTGEEVAEDKDCLPHKRVEVSKQPHTLKTFSFHSELSDLLFCLTLLYHFHLSINSCEEKLT